MKKGYFLQPFREHFSGPWRRGGEYTIAPVAAHIADSGRHAAHLQLKRQRLQEPKQALEGGAVVPAGEQKLRRRDHRKTQVSKHQMAPAYKVWW